MSDIVDTSEGVSEVVKLRHLRDELCAELAEAQAQVAALRTVSEFYANPFGRRDADGDWINVPDFYDEMQFGERASEALSALQPKVTP